MELSLFNAVSILEQPEGVIAVPGDCGYLLACRPDRREAALRLFRLTGLTLTQEGLLLGHDIDAFRPYVISIPECVEDLMHRHWPGPLAIRVHGNEALPMPEPGDINIQQPDRSLLLDLLSLVPTGALLTLPAARFGDASAPDAEAVYNNFGDDVDLVLEDAGNPPGMTPSTLVSVGPDGCVRVLRRGSIVID